MFQFNRNTKNKGFKNKGFNIYQEGGWWIVKFSNEENLIYLIFLALVWEICPKDQKLRINSISLTRQEYMQWEQTKVLIRVRLRSHPCSSSQFWRRGEWLMWPLLFSCTDSQNVKYLRKSFRWNVGFSSSTEMWKKSDSQKKEFKRL